MSSGETTLAVEPESLKHYRGAAHILGNIASAGFGIDFSPGTIANWESAFAFIKILDTAVDRGNEAIQSDAFAYFNETFGPGSSRIVAATSAFNSDLEKITQELRPQITDHQAQKFLYKGMQIFDTVGEVEHTVADIKEYAIITKLLGQLTASLMTTVTNPEDLAHPQYGQYIRFLRRMSRTANVVDSVSDFRRDYEEGTTRLEPTFANRVRLLASAVPEAVDSFKYIGFNSIKLVKPTVQTIGGHRERKQKEEPLESIQAEPLS